MVISRQSRQLIRQSLEDDPGLSIMIKEKRDSLKDEHFPDVDKLPDEEILEMLVDDMGDILVSLAKQKEEDPDNCPYSISSQITFEEVS